MATLPPGWAADYDGRRWFYQYTATGQVQYHFPTPGDEFPDFAGFLGGSSSGGAGSMGPAAELLPEERLESERQVRRREALGNNGGGSRSSSGNAVATNSGGARRKTAERDHCYSSSAAALGDDGDGDEGGGGMCSFESFGYLGPGCYEGAGEVSPPTTARGSVRGHARSEGSLASTGGVSSLTPPPSAEVAGSFLSQPVGEAWNVGQAEEEEEEEEEEERHKHSPPPLLPAKIRLTPTGTDRSTPSRAGDDNDGDQEGLSPPFEIPMLDGRAIPRASPVGRVAELASASTARCAEEVNPAPVELPDSGASWLEPVPVPNLVNQYPVELPTGAREDGPVPPSAPAAGGREGGRAGPQPAPRATVADYCSGMPSQRGQAPRVPPKIAHDGGKDEDENKDDERLHQEILDFFPERDQVPRALQVGVPKPASEAGARRKSTPSERRLGPVPSILRPGPRRSSQPAMVALRAATGTHATSPTPPSPPSSRHTEVTYQAFRPARPLKVDGAGAGGGRTQSSPEVDRPYARSERAREQQQQQQQQQRHHHHHQQPGTAAAGTVMGRPHAQSVGAPHSGSKPRHPDFAVMPDPSDHVSPAPFLSRSSTVPPPGEIVPASSSSSSPSPAQPAVSGPVRSSMYLAPGELRLIVPVGTAQHHQQHSHESSPIASTAHTSPTTARIHSDGDTSVGPLSPGTTESPSGNTIQPSITAPSVEEGTPPSISSRPTSFFQSPGTGSSDRNFKNMLRRVTRFGDAGAGGAQPVLVVNGSMVGESHMEYIPPKGKKEDVADWSWGHAK